MWPSDHELCAVRICNAPMQFCIALDNSRSRAKSTLICTECHFLKGEGRSLLALERNMRFEKANIMRLVKRVTIQCFSSLWVKFTHLIFLCSTLTHRLHLHRKGSPSRRDRMRLYIATAYKADRRINGYVSSQVGFVLSYDDICQYRLIAPGNIFNRFKPCSSNSSHPKTE